MNENGRNSGNEKSSLRETLHKLVFRDRKFKRRVSSILKFRINTQILGRMALEHQMLEKVFE